MRVVTLEPHQIADSPVVLRTGEAGLVSLGPDGSADARPRFALSPNSTHALLGHGVVEALNRLPLEGRIGEGLEAVIPPACLDDARALFYDADRNTYGRTWDFAVGRTDQPSEIRLRIDNREYQQTLTRLVDLVTQASREGFAVWLRI